MTMRAERVVKPWADMTREELIAELKDAKVKITELRSYEYLQIAKLHLILNFLIKNFDDELHNHYKREILESLGDDL